MNPEVESIITEATRREWKKQLAVGACGAALTVAALAGIGTWRATTHGGARKSVAASAPAARVISRARTTQLITYDLVTTQEQADQWKSQMLSDPDVEAARHVLVTVSSPEQELRVRRGIDEANNVNASGGPFIQVIDLRPNDGRSSEAAAPAR